MKNVALFGCGSLGANFAIALGRRMADSVKFYLIDYQKIEDENRKNQPWFDLNIGQKKVNVLSANLWHVSDTKSEAYPKKINDLYDIEKILINKKIDLLVDCFDSHGSRKLVHEYSIMYNKSCIHGGFTENIFKCSWGMITTKDNKRSPMCDRRELSPIVQVGSALLSESVYNFLEKNLRISYYFSLHGYEAKVLHCTL